MTGEVPDAMLDAVLTDAAQRLGVATDTLTVTSAQQKTWPNGALGCPKPGMFYTQAIVEGYQVEISAAGSTLDYRLDGRGRFVLCDSPPMTRPGSTP